MASPGMPKAMSNRLMTMKFMQRSAAKAATSEPSTPNGPPSKRVRLSNGASAPGTPGTPSDHEVIQAALAAEEKKRKEALEKAAVAAGETKWVLSFKDPQDGVRPEGMRVVQSGFAVIDGEDDKSDEGVRPVGRITFGKVVKKDNSSAPSGSCTDPESESLESDHDSDDPAAAFIRETKRETAAKQREAKRAQKVATQQQATRKPAAVQDEDMDLRGITSISGGSASGGGRSSGGAKDISCFICGAQGHMKKDCTKGRNFSGRGRGKRRK